MRYRFLSHLDSISCPSQLIFFYCWPFPQSTGHYISWTRWFCLSSRRMSIFCTYRSNKLSTRLQDVTECLRFRLKERLIVCYDSYPVWAVSKNHRWHRLLASLRRNPKRRSKLLIAQEQQFSSVKMRTFVVIFENLKILLKMQILWICFIIQIQIFLFQNLW